MNKSFKFTLNLLSRFSMVQVKLQEPEEAGDGLFYRDVDQQVIQKRCGMKRLVQGRLLWIAGLALMMLTACDKTSDDDEDVLGQTSAVTIGLNTHAVMDRPLHDVHLFLFGETNKLVQHNYYENAENLAQDRLLLQKGFYTIIALFNTESGLTPPESIRPETDTEATRTGEVPDISLSEFTEWLLTISDTYPDLLTGMTQGSLKQVSNSIIMEVKNKLAGIGVAAVALEMTFPSPLLSDLAAINARAAGAEVRLRTVIEAYNSGTGERVLRKEAFATKVNDEGLYSTSVILPSGSYNLCVWSDYAIEPDKDNHYITADLRKVRVQPMENYIANADTRDAFSQTVSVTVDAENQNKQITMNRPLAKYCLVATDVAQYEAEREEKQLPPLDELSITVVYNSYMPCAYNIAEGQPNDSKMGYRYTSAFSGQNEQEVTVGKDFIFVGDNQSSVMVSVLFKDKDGKIISRASGIDINYRAGYLTTVKGNFLTAGTAANGGVVIDTEWADEVYKVDF